MDAVCFFLFFSIIHIIFIVHRTIVLRGEVTLNTILCFLSHA